MKTDQDIPAMPMEPDRYADGVPSYIDHDPEIYSDTEELLPYQQRYEYHMHRVSTCESVILSKAKPGAKVLAVAEGTGEFAISLAKKFPLLTFYAFDRDLKRVRIAMRLAAFAEVRNIRFFHGGVERIPFPDKFFSGVIERGCFHILPLEVKRRNLLELERVCAGPVVMNWMVANAYIYLGWGVCSSLKHKSMTLMKAVYSTFGSLDKSMHTLPQMAAFIGSVTGHKVEIIRNWDGGCTELERPRSDFLSRFSILGCLAYDTTENAGK